ncbi:uncharacterized protein LOC143025578 [Oratosquilla oratoria]|uniref:uncharacterized protein LOC143025578 n=1 Tax=Oratosquilla oratoria TaxID=337810 RepID=UPI003F766352
MRLARLSMFSRDNKKIGWLRHVVTAISVVIFLVGCAVIGYMAWVLATSITVSRFLSGNLFFTYAVISLGLLYFLTGLVGWVAGASEVTCIIRLYLTLLVFSIAFEIGGIIALNILDTKLDDILMHGWAEVNQGTRNIVQRSFDCCGFYGPKEFAYTNYPIDDSCYNGEGAYVDNLASIPSADFDTAQQLKQVGCGGRLKLWFEENRAIWCSVLAVLGGLQLMCVILCAHIINKLRDKSEASRWSSRRRLHDKNGYSL